MAHWKHLLFFLAFTLIICIADAGPQSTTSKSGTPAERKERYKSLLLQYFAAPRHPFLADTNWLNARAGVVSEFQKIVHNVPNAAMEIQNFKTELTFAPGKTTEFSGQNIIVTFKGRNWQNGTDQILVIGAHYDSDASPLFCIDDNGSGVVAMLEVARQLSTAIVDRKAVLHNTVIFVAFDFQRFEYEMNVGTNTAGGSKFFVDEKLSEILNAPSRPTFLGAIILDSVMNFNGTAGSQILPSGFDKSFPEAYSYVYGNSFKGNYLAMVTKERLRSLQLDYVIAQEWNTTDTQGQFPLVQLEVRRLAPSPALFEFLQQDHVPFWNYENNPYPAVLLTDTGKRRGIQKMCGTTMCDSASMLTTDRLNMLDQVVMTLNRFLLQSHVTEQVRSSGSSTYFGISTSILTILVAYLI